jgi:hypothetical protein
MMEDRKEQRREGRKERRNVRGHSACRAPAAPAYCQVVVVWIARLSTVRTDGRKVGREMGRQERMKIGRKEERKDGKEGRKEEGKGREGRK